MRAENRASSRPAKEPASRPAKEPASRGFGRPVVLVTGCSSGIGRAAVPMLARGARVVATARDPASIEDLSGEFVSTHRLDVTKTAERKAAVKGTIERYGRIDALVNNAGFGATLAVEETDSDLMQRMFDVNLFGVHALTQLVLPHMNRGRIVNVASIAGHVAVPMLGAYCASKFALRALTQAMHVELRPFGIHACLVEPGLINTRFSERNMAETSKVLPHPDQSRYSAVHAKWHARRTKGRGANPDVIAKQIAHACLARRPRFHYFAPFHAKAANIAKRLTPDIVLNAGMRSWMR